jgi:hypothetical protein
LLISIKIKNAGITLNTAKALRSRIEMLPSVPDWKLKKITLTGHTTKDPMFLFYRNAPDCVEYLFSNPLFADKIDFCPVQLYRNVERSIRIYTEWMTGNTAWKMQVSIHPY